LGAVVPPAAFQPGQSLAELAARFGDGEPPADGVHQSRSAVAERVVAELIELGVVGDARDERGQGVVHPARVIQCLGGQVTGTGDAGVP
jgi:hypothetical protein